MYSGCLPRHFMKLNSLLLKMEFWLRFISQILSQYASGDYLE